MNEIKLTRKERDHLRYMADRERRLKMQKEWDKAHPNYHTEYVRRRVRMEIDKQIYLKRLSIQILKRQQI